MPVVMPINELQRNFKEIVDKCERSSEPVYLTRNGSASVIVMDAEAFDRKMAIHERVRDREICVQKSIMRGYEDCLADRFIPLAQALDEADRAREAR